MAKKSKLPFGSKAAFVRANPNIKASDLVKLAKKQGIIMTSGHIYNIRAEGKKKPNAASSSSVATKPSTTASTSGLPRLDAQLRTLVIRIGLDRAEQIFSDLKSTLARMA